jgi:Flp pilus assembly protein TadD
MQSFRSNLELVSERVVQIMLQRTLTLGGISLVAAAALTLAIGLMLRPIESELTADGDLSSASPPPAHNAQPAASASQGQTAVTFNRDVAPIIFKHCSTCHHEGEAVPFHLMSYADVKKRAQQISEVVTTRYMPPWMPARGLVEFEGERGLSNEEIAVIRKWAGEGAVEGDEKELPPTPTFASGWILGTPDHVAKMPEPFVVPAEGKDIYRNFVVPVGLPEGKWIKGVHVRTGESSVVHHGFVFVDSTGNSAKQNDAAEPGVGYSGMDPGSGVERPVGQSLSWQPGKQPKLGPEAMSWWLPRHSDLVLQMHLRPSGKEEHVQAEVAIYFSATPPTLKPAALMLRSVDIDIPPGVANYAIESSYVLPVDLEVIGVLPHAHYLARKVEAWATLPDGHKQSLLRINDWNFDWQGDYRYARPLTLPARSQIAMRIEYDNSEGNAHNPHRPPQQVKYGLESSDEMGEVHFQVLPRNEQDWRLLDADYRRSYALPDSIAAARALLKNEPTSAERMVRLGVALMVGDEIEEAMGLFNQALAIEPADAKARYHLGHAYAKRNDTARAVEEWKEVVRIDPRHFRAQNNLGYWYLAQKDLERAEEHLLAAVAANENDVMSRVNLARVYAAKQDWQSVQRELEEALKVEPRNPAVTTLLKSARENALRPGGTP